MKRNGEISSIIVASGVNSSSTRERLPVSTAASAALIGAAASLDKGSAEGTPGLIVANTHVQARTEVQRGFISPVYLIAIVIVVSGLTTA